MEVRLTLTKGKDGVYNPYAPTLAVADGRPDGHMKTKAARGAASATDRRKVAVIDQAMHHRRQEPHRPEEGEVRCEVDDVAAET